MRIRELREERTLTQSEVAAGIKTSQRNIGRWEREEVLPSSDFIIRLSDFFNVSADYLLGRSDDFGNIILQSENTFATSPLEQQLILDYRSLTPPLQRMILETMQTFKQSEINTKKGVS